MTQQNSDPGSCVLKQQHTELPSDGTVMMAATTGAIATMSSLPDDILQCIFGHIEPVLLAQHVDFTCRRFRALTPHIYQRWYGKVHAHRKVDAFKPDWKHLALEKENFMTDRGTNVFDPPQVMKEILNEWYLSADDDIIEIAAICILSLHESPEKGTQEWYEAMATALMAQDRPNEAQHAYGRLSVDSKSLPEQTWLTAMRFKWQFLDQLPSDPSAKILQRAVLGATAARNLKAVQKLEARGIDLALSFEGDTVATVAARHGSLPIIQYLATRNIDVLLAPQKKTNTPLREAANEGHGEILDFLLRHALRVEPQICTDYELFDCVLRHGHVEILRLLIGCVPSFASAKDTNGDLVVGRNLEHMSHPVRVIRFLYNKMGMDINAANDWGRTLLHVAAEQGNLIIVKLLCVLGGSLHVRDKTGQTPQEVAGTAGHRELSVWLAVHTNTSIQSMESKQFLAHEVVTVLRNHLIELIMQGQHGHLSREASPERFANVETLWHAEGMDTKLTKVFSTSFSWDTLKRYKSEIYDSEVGNLLRKLQLISTPVDQVSDEDSRKLPIVGSICQNYLNPYITAADRERVVLNICRLPKSDLQKIHEFYCSDFGIALAASYKYKALEQSSIMENFSRMLTQAQ